MKLHKQHQFKLTIFAVVVMAMVLSGCGNTTVPAQENTAEGASIEAAAQTENTTKAPDGTDATSASSAVTEAAPAEEDREIRITVTQTRIETQDRLTPSVDGSSQMDPIPYGYVNYPSFTVSDATAAQYPKMKSALDQLSKQYEEKALKYLAEEQKLMEDMVSYGDENIFSSNEQNWDAQILRADEKVVSILIVEESYYNGVHPCTTYTTHFLDVQDGEFYPLSDVVNDMRSLPDILYNNLEFLDDTYVLDEDEQRDVKSRLNDLVADGGVPFTVGEETFSTYFEPYALMYYAFGPIFANLEYKTWPNLIKQKYLPPDDQAGRTPLEKRISTVRDEEPKIWSAKALEPYYVSDEYEEDGDPGQAYWTVECPSWNEDVYAAKNVTDPVGECLIELIEDKDQRKTTDWLDQDAWSRESGIPLPPTAYNGPYTVGEYTYSVVEPDGSLLLNVSDINGIPYATYDFTAYRNVPVPGNEFTELSIPYAEIYDGILYTEIAHRTYSADMPYTGFIVAVDAATGKLLWRSDMLRANAHNFLIIDDQIVCGYGFTAEDDYVYILSRHNGQEFEHWKVKSGPDYFIRTEDGAAVWILTYNTAYKYKLSFG